MSKSTSYHYLECGLDNIWLTNGHETRDTGYGPGTSITDVDELHKVIGLALANQKERLTGAEIRFIRNELDLSQNVFSRLLGVSEQTFARWEKDSVKISGPAQNLLSGYYRETVEGNANLTKHMQIISELDAKIHEIKHLVLTKEHDWKVQAA